MGTMMKLPFVIAGAIFLALAACADRGAEQPDDPAVGGAAQPSEVTPTDPSVEDESTEVADMMAAPVCVKEVPPDAICTMDLNACGHASTCNCGDGYVYNAAMGKCTLDLQGVGDATFVEVTDNDCVRPATGVCTRDINACGQPSSCGCDDGYVWNDVAGKCVRDL